MKIRILKEILKQYDDNDLIYLKCNLATTYRIDHCDIKTSKWDDTLIPIIDGKKDEKTNSLVLMIE